MFCFWWFGGGGGGVGVLVGWMGVFWFGVGFLGFFVLFLWPCGLLESFACGPRDLFAYHAFAGIASVAGNLFCFKVYSCSLRFPCCKHQDYRISARVSNKQQQMETRPIACPCVELGQCISA